MDDARKNSLASALAACRRPLAFIGLFSLAVNLLMLTAPIYLMQVFDRVLSSASRTTLLYLTLIAAGALIVLALLEVVRGRALARLGTWLEGRLAPEALGRTLDNALFADGDRTDALRDLGSVRSFLGSSAVLTLFDAPWVPAYLAVIYLFDPLLGHVALAGAALLFALALANDRLTHALHRQAGQAGQRARAGAQAALRNADAVDAMGMAEGLVRRWSRDGGRALAFHDAAARRGAAVLGISKFVRLFTQVALLGVGAILVLDQQITGGTMIAASIIMSRALAPVEQAIGAWKQAVQALEAKRRLDGFFARRPRRPESISLPAPRGRLTVENVLYGFVPGRPPVLKNVSFALEPGQALAILGPSAAGKSTLARLLVGINRPLAGAVRLDGAEVFAWRRDELSRHVGYLPQDVELFSGTVAENIARLAEPDDAQVVAAAKLAHCHDMILRLDKGYQTELGEGGARLSGGQRQRIALARAVYGEPRLVVLDEPNASLDGEGELALNRAIAELKARGAAVVVIGHRPGALAAVDFILVLVDGRVEQIGPRQAILEGLVQRAPRPVPSIGKAAPARLPQEPPAAAGP